MNKLIGLAAVSLLSMASICSADPAVSPAAAVTKTPPVMETKAVGAERVQLPASQGTVNFPHRKHQEMLHDCSNCHASAPGKIPGLGKDWAHSTCRGCHNETAKAPVQCSGCHSVGAATR
jgi:predicted CXXCH cytochrome family protein